MQYPGDAVDAVARVTLALDLRGYFGSQPDSFRFTFGPLFGGLLSVDLDVADVESGTAFSPYDFELSMEMRNAPAPDRGEWRKRAGREVFDRLMTLNVPLAYSGGVDLFADYLPGRGVREFPSGTGWEGDDRDAWFEPRLHGTERPGGPADSGGSPRPEGSVRIFEAGGLVHLVAWIDEAAVAPVASVRAEAGPGVLGRVLAETLGRSRQESRLTSADPWSWVTGTAALAPGEYAHAAVSIDIDATENGITVLPHDRAAEPVADRVTQGPAVESLMVRQPGPWDDTSTGDLVLRCIRELRARVPSS
jgi:hypothetical protein